MDELIYNEEYLLFRDGEYIGTAIWKQDDNIGDSFISTEVKSSGVLVNKVYSADSWTIVNNN